MTNLISLLTMLFKSNYFGCSVIKIMETIERYMYILVIICGHLTPPLIYVYKYESHYLSSSWLWMIYPCNCLSKMVPEQTKEKLHGLYKQILEDSHKKNLLCEITSCDRNNWTHIIHEGIIIA